MATGLERNISSTLRSLTQVATRVVKRHRPATPRLFRQRQPSVQDRFLHGPPVRPLSRRAPRNPEASSRLCPGGTLWSSQNRGTGPRTLLLAGRVGRHQPLRDFLRDVPTQPSRETSSMRFRTAHRHPGFLLAASAHGLDGRFPWLVPSVDDGPPFDSILTFIDRLSGMCRFVPARSSDTAEDTAMHLINNVIRNHGGPDIIIADNDVRQCAGF